MADNNLKQKPDDYWRHKLTSEQFAVLRGKGTEQPFSGDLLEENRSGMFVCGACGTPLFKSESKYESNLPGLLGWPSFAEAVSSDAVELARDSSHGMERTEVLCGMCGGHLGHVFDDNTSPTGKHYCINSASLNFNAAPESE
jgi:peptide-methionine (R)-S-oxide reductase